MGPFLTPPDTAQSNNTIPTGQRLIHGKSEMAELIRTHNWAASSLGPIASWPQSLRSAVNQMLGCGFPTAIWWKGAEGVQFYNDGYRPFLGTKHPRGLGQCPKDCWKEAWDLVDEQVCSVLEHGEPLFFENRLVPIKVNGVVQDVYWRYSYSPVFGDAGDPEGVMVTCQDVTDAYVSAQKLRESTEELHQVLEASNDAIVSVDREWRFSYFNPRAEGMFNPDHRFLGSNIWEAFPEARAESSPYIKHYCEAMDHGIARHFEAYYPEPLNAWMRIEFSPTPRGIVVFVRDISELRRTTAALLQNEKLAAVGRLAASIAHEINNPLESVTNLLFLARSIAEDEDVQKYLDLAERELRRVSVISNQTLRFYKQSTNPTAVSCRDLFAEVLSIYQGRLVNSRINIEERLRASAPLECFEGEIRQVLSNLIGNAIDAMHPAGGRLFVRSRGARDWKTGRKGIALTVADTGHGMSPQTRQKVFEAFYTTKGIGGTGLGLWVSKEIVDRHHGCLYVRSSNRKGQSGTVFVLFLPTQAVDRR